MDEREDQRVRAGIELARWQGGVDKALENAEERLRAQESNYALLGTAFTGLRQDIRDQAADIREIKATAAKIANQARFRWTKLSALAAIGGVVAVVAFNFYFATRH